MISSPTDLPNSLSLPDIQHILSENHLGLWSWNARVNIFLMDPYWRRMLGIPQPEMGISGEDIFSLVHPEDAPDLEKQWSHALEQQVASEIYIFRLRTFDGKYIWVYFSASFTCSFNEEIDCTEAKGIILDLSDTMSTVSRLYSANLGQKDHFLSSISHELRTPINAIIGLSQFAQSHAPSALYKEYNQRVLQSAQDLLNLVNDLLDFSSLQSSTVTLSPSPLEPRKLLKLIRDNYQEEARSKHLIIEVKIEPQVPRFILSDWERLYLLIDNLVSNSLKFTSKGRIQIYLGIEKGSHNRAYRLIFRVRDTGIGMDPKKLKNLFEPFTQGDSSNTRKYGGTGIGLALVKKIAQALESKLTVATEPGRGTTISAYVPYTPPTLPSIPLICIKKEIITFGMLRDTPYKQEISALADSMQIRLEVYDSLTPVRPPDGWFLDASLIPDPSINEPVIPVTTEPNLREALVLPAQSQAVFEHFAQVYCSGSKGASELMTLGGIPLLLLCTQATKVEKYQQLFERYGIWVTVGHPQKLGTLPNLGIDYVVTVADLYEDTKAEALRKDLDSWESTRKTLLIWIGNDAPSSQTSIADVWFPRPVQDTLLLESISKLIQETKLKTHSAHSQLSEPLAIDLAQGLERVEGDKELYVSMLSSFIDQSPDYLSYLENLKQSLESQGMLTDQEKERAHFYFHQIKGSAAGIQAPEIIACCLEWEQAKESEKYSISFFQKALIKVQELVNSLKHVLNNPSYLDEYVLGNDSKGSIKQRLQEKPSSLAKLLDKISKYLSNYQIMDSELMHQFETYLKDSNEARETFALFKKKVWSLQYDNALILLSDLQNTYLQG